MIVYGLFYKNIIYFNRQRIFYMLFLSQLVFKPIIIVNSYLIY